MADPKKPMLAVTMGDPAGIGPEVIVGAWTDSRMHEQVRPFVVGHPEILRRAARLVGRRSYSDASPRPVWSLRIPGPRAIPCLNACSDDVSMPPATRRRPCRRGRIPSVSRPPPLPLRCQDRWHRHRAAEQGGAPRRRPPLSGPHRAAGRNVRRDRLRHDALPAAGDAVQSPQAWASSTSRSINRCAACSPI